MEQITGGLAKIHLQEETEAPELLLRQEEERKRREESILRQVLTQVPTASEEDMAATDPVMVEPGELPWDDPVSYTHLDVYKRQVSVPSFIWRAGNVIS